jgi:hypothetical protein
MSQMFSFEKQYKNYEQAIDRLKEVNEFWVNAIIASLKQLVK